MFVTGIMLNRKPGGNGAHSDQADNPEEVGKIVGVLAGTDGWAQLFGEGKFMMITGSEGAFTLAVTAREEPPRKFVVSRVEIGKVIEAAKAFAEDGRMLEGLTWAPEAMKQPGNAPAAKPPATSKPAGSPKLAGGPKPAGSHKAAKAKSGHAAPNLKKRAG
jgi:hypothetical protein